MRNMLRFFSLCALAIVLTGCWQKSLHPFYTSKDLNQNPAIAGSWVEAKENGSENDETWTFAESAPSEYRLTITDGDETMEYDIRLFRLDDAQYIDFHSRRREISEIPAHHLFRAVIETNKLQLQALNPEWIAEHASEVEHITVQNGDPEKKEVILTANTAALQQFLRRHRKEKEFFSDPVLFKPAPEAKDR